MNYDKRKQQLLASGLSLLIVTSLVTSVSLVATQPARAQTPINSCMTITQSGEYELTQDITNNTATTCIDIRANNVVIDGNGHTISSGGSGDFRTGVNSTNQVNITISDLSLSEWGDGIEFISIDQSKVSNVNISNPTTGINVENGNNNIIQKSNIAGSSFAGIRVDGSSNTTISNNTLVGDINSDGIDLFDSEFNLVSSNNIRNTSVGIGGGSNDIITNNTVVNGENGIWVGENETVRYNTVINQSERGIQIGDDSIAQNNTVADSFSGVSMGEASDNGRIINNSLNNNDYGVILTYCVIGGCRGTNDVTIEENTISDSNESGINLFNSNGNLIRNNSISESGSSGIRINGEVSNNLIYNNALNNTQNVEFGQNFTEDQNQWNVSNQSGPNIIGGPYLGGNYYATPASDGFSQTCTDANNDGFCDQPNDFGIDNNNTDFLPLTRVNGQQQPDIDVSPTRLNFGKVTVGDSETKNVTVTNTGTGTLDVSATDIIGPDASAFSIVNGEAPFSLAPGESQNVTVEFAPTSKSTKTATLQIESNDPDEPTTTVKLCGKGAKEDDSVFPDPLVIKKHGKVLFKIGPPQDLNGDSLYEDVNGDDTFNVKDVVALAIVENAYQHDHLDLNSQQVAALDFNHDSKLTQKDVIALAIDLFKGNTGWRSQLKGSDWNRDGTTTTRDRTLGHALLNDRDLVKVMPVDDC
jgi:parallel beta-helix repeat protein